jgi:hypothetical protein
MGHPSKDRWTLTMTVGSALIGELLGGFLGYVATTVVWWLIGTMLGYGADDNVALFFYGFLAVFLFGIGGVVAGPVFVRRWWTRKSAIRL